MRGLQSHILRIGLSIAFLAANKRLFVIGLVASSLFGCSNPSRYGVTYDERLPTIKRVAVYPASINVVSLHTGGVPEPRPDLLLLAPWEEALENRDKGGDPEKRQRIEIQVHGSA